MYVTVGWAVLIVVGTIWLRVRTRRIAVSRPGETFDNFQAAFAPDEASSEVLRAVYMTFQAWCSGAVAGFPVRADDDILGTYGMADEDLEDAVMDVLAACERVLPPGEAARRMGPVVTVRGFVGVVAACPRATARSTAVASRIEGAVDHKPAAPR